MKRFDLAVAAKYSISRSFASKLIKEHKAQLQGVYLDNPSKRIDDDADIYIRPEDLILEAIPSYLTAEAIPLDVLYEDVNTLVINKQAGISVHPSLAEPNHTIVNALLYKYQQLQEAFQEEPMRPGIVHRLDKETSGVLIIAKNRATQMFLSEQFRQRQVYKEYLALVQGNVEKPVVVDKSIARNKKDRKKMAIDENGRNAYTQFFPKNHYKKDSTHSFTMVLAIPKTGRTHQIRVHLKSLGYPIVGDTIYHGYPNDHMLLHAQTLRIALPDIGMREFVAKTPVYFDEFLAPLHALPK